MKITIQPQRLGELMEEDEAAGLSPSTLKVANDWRYAVYLLLAGAVAGKVSVAGLDMFEDVAEKRFFEALQDNAVRMSIRAEFVSVTQGAKQAFQFDLAGSPHLYLPLIILAAHAKGTSVLSSVRSAIDLDAGMWEHRINVLQAVGFELKLQDDLLIIKGNGRINTDTVTHTQDAELLAALSICALNAEGAVSISDAHLIADIFPGLISDLNSLLETKVGEEG